MSGVDLVGRNRSRITAEKNTVGKSIRRQINLTEWMEIKCHRSVWSYSNGKKWKRMLGGMMNSDVCEWEKVHREGGLL